jgi:hypothetical protein
MAGLGGAALWPFAVPAQQTAMPLIGFLSSGRSRESSDEIAGYHAGLAEAGFFEGRNVVIEYRWAEGQYTVCPLWRAISSSIELT